MDAESEVSSIIRMFLLVSTVLTLSTTVVMTTSIETQVKNLERKYPLKLQPELDVINVDKYLENDRLMDLQIKCVLHDGPCDIVGRWVKPRVVAAFLGECPLCTPKQAINVMKIIAYMQEKRAEEYKMAIVKYLHNFGIEPADMQTPTPASNNSKTLATTQTAATNNTPSNGTNSNSNITITSNSHLNSTSTTTTTTTTPETASPTASPTSQIPTTFLPTTVQG